MKNAFIVATLGLFLSGCPGGWRTEMISIYSLTRPSPGIKEYQKYYPGLIAPAVTVDNAILMQWGSSNPHDLAYKEPVDAPYHISGYVSSKIDNVSIDLSSFMLDNLEGSIPLRPEVSLAPKRVRVNISTEGGRTLCDFSPNELVVASGVVRVPKYDIEEWPPKDIDDSILCVLLNFKISIREISPEKQFQVHFRYFIRGIQKEATLYFYPIKFRWFRS